MSYASQLPFNPQPMSTHIVRDTELDNGQCAAKSEHAEVRGQATDKQQCFYLPRIISPLLKAIVDAKQLIIGIHSKI